MPYLDLTRAVREVHTDIQAAMEDVLSSGVYIGGDEVRSLEKEFAAYCGARHCVAVSSGLAALRLCLTAWGIGPGDEVIVPAWTFVATWLAVSHTGATPVPVEPDPRTMNLDPEDVERVAGDRTRAIVPVHLYGRPAPMGRLLSLAAERGWFVLEDAAQAHGARVGAGRAGAVGHAGAFSFYPTKNIGALGDAGAVVTSDPELAARITALRSYGLDEGGAIGSLGFNERMDPLQAAILRVKLRRLEAWYEARRGSARRYFEELSGLAGLTLPARDLLEESSWHLFVVRHPDRDAFRERLAARGVGSLIHYPCPPHMARAYRAAEWRRRELPLTEELARTVVSLPLHPHLEPDQVEKVVREVRGSVR